MYLWFFIFSKIKSPPSIKFLNPITCVETFASSTFQDSSFKLMKTHTQHIHTEKYIHRGHVYLYIFIHHHENQHTCNQQTHTHTHTSVSLCEREGIVSYRDLRFSMKETGLEV